jgi:glucose-1-phosphate thymidylyltransferase
MKGILLAGGAGTRLHPVTQVISKQLLPVYDKPLIYYPLSTLLLAGVREVLVITSRSQQDLFKQLLADGEQFGVKIEYGIQEEPNGIAESFIIGQEFIAGSKCALALGDNIFHGVGLGRGLQDFVNVIGAQVFGYKVADPRPYGVAEVDGKKVVGLEEKPLEPRSNIAVPGLYFFDEKVTDYVSELRPSPRGELEITDLLRKYMELGTLSLEMLPRGTAWFDSGTFRDLHDASSFVRLLEERTGERVGDPYEVARTQGWII